MTHFIPRLSFAFYYKCLDFAQWVGRPGSTAPTSFLLMVFVVRVTQGRTGPIEEKNLGRRNPSSESTTLWTNASACPPLLAFSGVIGRMPLSPSLPPILSEMAGSVFAMSHPRTTCSCLSPEAVPVTKVTGARQKM